MHPKHERMEADTILKGDQAGGSIQFALIGGTGFKQADDQVFAYETKMFPFPLMLTKIFWSDSS
jgi:hypothetical protein